MTMNINATLNAYVEECRGYDSWSAWMFGVEQTIYDRWRCGLAVPIIMALQSFFMFFASFRISDVLVVFFLFLLYRTFMVSVRQIATHKLRPLWFSARGIYVINGESIQPGSQFRPKAAMPRCQIEVYTPGVLYDTFIGYGIRVDDVLVMPTHVYHNADNGLLLKTGAKSYLLEATPILSEILSDVCYFLLDGSIWAQLGVSSAKVTGAPNGSKPVVVTGPRGASSGFVSRNTAPYILNYTGSTIPGYSGAAYVHNGSVIGMHAGETNGVNIGYGMGAISTEISVLIYGQDLRFEAKSKQQKTGLFQAKHWKNNSKMYEEDEAAPAPWNDRDVYSDITKVKGNKYINTPVVGKDYQDTINKYRGNPDSDDWAEQAGHDVTWHCESNTTLPKELTEALSDFSVNDLESIGEYVSALTKVRKTSQIRMRPHGAEGFDFVEVETNPQASTSYVLNWQEKIEERLTKVETQLASLTKRQGNVGPSKKAHPCTFCDKSFSTMLGLVSHKMTKHADFKPETAIRGDETTQVKTKPVGNSFLGKGPKKTSTTSLPQRKRSNSLENFPLNTVTSPSSRPQPKLKKTSPSRQDIVKAFDSFQQVIFGLLEAQKQ